MRTKQLFYVIGVFVALGFFTQCERYGAPTGKGGGGGGDLPDPDEDSDRPAWAGGNTSENPHNKQGDGGTNGGNTVDYGDLYVLYRDLDGLPVMRDIVVVDEEGNYLETIWVVQPMAEDGRLLELDGEGGIMPDELEFAQPVDFGRLNIVRSPQSVLDQAMGEALKVINAGERFTVDFCGRLTIWNTVDDVLTITKTIDSPRESMALYQELMNHGYNDQLQALIGSGIEPYTLAASCFAAGSDKTGTVNIDEVVYINGFIDCLGCDSIPNQNEYLKNNNLKYYFNFGDCDCLTPDNQPFTYDRNVYRNRNIKLVTLNPDGTWNTEVVSVWKAMEDRGLFMYKWPGDPLTRVNGFTAAVDDAVQVLEFIHGDSNIEFLPEVPQ